MTFNKAIRSLPRAPRRSTPTRTPTEIAELAQLEDSALVALCLERDEHAWCEFLRRYDAPLRARARGKIGYALRNRLDSDALDDVMGAFYVRMVEQDMVKLKQWQSKERKGPLIVLLTMICNGIAMDHARLAFNDADARCKAVDKAREADRDPNRGGMWFAMQERNGRDRIKKGRTRLDRDE